jgi:hypothetical protein
MRTGPHQPVKKEIPMTKTTKTSKAKTVTKAPTKKAPAKEPTMAELLTTIRAAKHFTVYALIDGEKNFSEHPNLHEAGKAALHILTRFKKRPLVSAISKTDEPTTIIETVWRQAATATPKAAKKPATDKASTPHGQRAAITAAAEAGKLPEPPDFSAETHKRFRPKLEELKKLVAAKDIKGLKAFAINPVSSSPKALDKFRNLAVTALEAQA